MATRIPTEFIPIEMAIIMITKQYPDLAPQLERIRLSSENNPLAAQDKIREAVQVYEMYLANGRLKPKALCS